MNFGYINFFFHQRGNNQYKILPYGETSLSLNNSEMTLVAGRRNACQTTRKRQEGDGPSSWQPRAAILKWLPLGNRWMAVTDTSSVSSRTGLVATGSWRPGTGIPCRRRPRPECHLSAWTPARTPPTSSPWCGPGAAPAPASCLSWGRNVAFKGSPSTRLHARGDFYRHICIGD